MTLDLTKPLRLKNGEKYLLKATDSPGDYSLLGLRFNSRSEWDPVTHTKEGIFNLQEPDDDWNLENVPVELDWDKLLRLRDGRQYQWLCDDMCNANLTLGRFKGKEGWQEILHNQKGEATGNWINRSEFDLVNFSLREPIAWLSLDKQHNPPSPAQTKHAVLWLDKPKDAEDNGVFWVGGRSGFVIINRELDAYLQRNILRGTCVPLYGEPRDNTQKALLRFDQSAGVVPTLRHPDNTSFTVASGTEDLFDLPNNNWNSTQLFYL